jgi:hypothetical protein
MVPPTSDVCVKGHSFCEKCIDGLVEKICPLCAAPIKKKANSLLDDIINSIRFPCENRKFGCEESLYIESLTNHEYVCMYKKRSCPLSTVNGGCTWNGMSKDLKEHLFVFHPRRITAVEADEISTFSKLVSDDEYDPFCDSYLFTVDEVFLHSAICTPTLFCCIVQYVCPKANAERYGYRVTLYTKEFEAETFERVVLSNNHDLHDVLEKRKCIYIPANKLERFYHFIPGGLREVRYFLEIYEVRTV